jgi:hypothetical protein
MAAPFSFLCSNSLRTQSSFCFDIVIFVDGTKKALQRQVNGAKKEQQKGRSTKTPSSLVACVCLRTRVRVFFSVQVDNLQE